MYRVIILIMSVKKEVGIYFGKNKYILLLSLVSSIICSIEFYLEYNTFQVGAKLFIHFYILLIISFILSLFLYFSKGDVQKIILILVRYLVFLLIGYPLGSNILIEVILFSAIICETVFLLDISRSIVILLFMNFVLILTQQNASAWNEELDPVLLYDLISAGFINVCNTCFAYILRTMMSKVSRQHNEISNMNEAIKKISEINIGFQNFVKDQELNILQEERKRMSREIHDTVGYTLTNIIMMMEALNVAGDSDEEEIQFIIKNTKGQALKGLEDTRYALRVLRKKEIPQKHGVNMIYELVNAFRLASGIDISVHFGNLRDSIDTDIDRIIFRFIQEGMTNVFRHGMATKIDIKFWISNNNLSVAIEDNGPGADEIVEGIGLTGMRERLTRVNGVLYLSNVENGFRVEIIIPLKNEKEISDAEDSGDAG